MLDVLYNLTIAALNFGEQPYFLKFGQQLLKFAFLSTWTNNHWLVLDKITLSFVPQPKLQFKPINQHKPLFALIQNYV